MQPPPTRTEELEEMAVLRLKDDDFMMTLLTWSTETQPPHPEYGRGGDVVEEERALQSLNVDN
jgi:hypothetical protein